MLKQRQIGVLSKSAWINFNKKCNVLQNDKLP